MGVTTRRMVLNQVSPISRAVVSQVAFIFARVLFIIRYGVEKKCTTLQMTRRKNVFCTGVPEKVNRNAMPITMPGMVLVTRAMLSMDVLKPLVQAASGSCKGCPVHNQGAGQGGQGRNQDEFLYTATREESRNTSQTWLNVKSI